MSRHLICAAFLLGPVAVFGLAPGQSCIQPVSHPCCDYTPTRFFCDAQCLDCCPLFQSAVNTDIATGGYASGWSVGSYITNLKKGCWVRDAYCVGTTCFYDDWKATSCINHEMEGVPNCGN
jgi:hypothetical protein